MGILSNFLFTHQYLLTKRFLDLLSHSQALKLKKMKEKDIIVKQMGYIILVCN